MTRRCFCAVSGLLLLASCGSLDTKAARKDVVSRIRTSGAQILDDPDNDLAWDSYRLHLYSDWEFERIKSTVYLRVLAAKSPRAIDELLVLTEDTNPAVAQDAVVTLGLIGPRAERAVPRLIELIRSNDLHLTVPAINAIGEIAEPNDEIVNLLTGLASETEYNSSRRLAVDVAVKKLKRRMNAD